MAHPINDAKQRFLDLKSSIATTREKRNETRDELSALLRKQAGGTTLSQAEHSRLEAAETRLTDVDTQLSRDERAVVTAERELLQLERARDVEDAQLAVSPSGRIPGTRPSRSDDDRPAVTGLPPLPSRTMRALAQLYPQAGGTSSEQRELEWRGVLGAALGGQPLHPAVLAATATEGVPSEGGYAVTVEVAAGLFMRAAEESVWLRIGVPLFPMTSEERVANAIDDDDETDDAEGSLKASWKGEGVDAGDPQILKVRQVKLTARKLVLLAAASNELADDSPSYVTALEAALARAIGKKLDRSVLSGTGAGQPLGILNSPATITVTKETGQPAATFKWENATAMWARLAAGSHERSWWLMHPTVLPQALSMHLVIGTAGTQPAAVFQMGGPTGYTLLGRPVLVTSRVKALGTKGDIILADPTQLAVGVRRGITIERSEHAFFSTDRLAIRGKFRGDARPFWEKARTPVEGSTTVSPVVVLEAR